MRQGVYGFVLGVIVGGASAIAFAIPGNADDAPYVHPELASAAPPAESRGSSNPNRRPDRVLGDTVSRGSVRVDTASLGEVLALEASVADRDARIEDLEAQVAQLRTASLAAQFVGMFDRNDEPVDIRTVDQLLSEIAEGDKFATIPDVEAMLRTLGPQNTFRIMETADRLVGDLVDTRGEHSLRTTEAEHRAWMQHTWPSVVSDEIRLAADDLHRLGAPGYVVEALRQKTQELFLR